MWLLKNAPEGEGRVTYMLDLSDEKEPVHADRGKGQTHIRGDGSRGRRGMQVIHFLRRRGHI